jgi:membrane protein YqaA with SNARE-associated domain
VSGPLAGRSVVIMLGTLMMTAAVAAGSALLPLISVEVFVIGLMALHPALPVLAIGAAAGIGQLLGKTPYFLAARGSIRLPRWVHRERPLSQRRHRMQLLRKRLRSVVDGVRERCLRHPKWLMGSYAVSSVTGLPPLLTTTVLAGVGRMPVAVFLTTGILGRTIRFTLLAAAPALLAGWWS